MTRVNANSSVNELLHQQDLLEWVLHYGRDHLHTHTHTHMFSNAAAGACHMLLGKVHLFDIHITQVTFQHTSCPVKKRLSK